MGVTDGDGALTETIETEYPELDTAYPVTDEQIASLHEQGWARLPGLLSRRLVEDIRSRLASEQPRSGYAVVKSYSREGDTTSGVDDGGEAKQWDPNVSHEAMAWRDPFFHGIATSRRVAGCAVRLMGQPTALLAQDISFIKPPGGGPSRLHQDYSHLPVDRKGEVAVWITLNDISDEMGPLHYLEGSHLEGPLGVVTDDEICDIYPHLRDRKLVAGTALSAGDAQIHWDLTVHGAGANNSDAERAAYTIRYIRGDTIYSGIGHPHFDSFQLAPGSPFADSGAFPRVGSDGLIEA